MKGWQVRWGGLFDREGEKAGRGSVGRREERWVEENLEGIETAWRR